MPMDYSKLFVLMREKNLTTYRIRKENIISQSTLQKLREGKSVTTETLGALCEVLNCQPGDIMEYIRPKEAIDERMERLGHKEAAFTAPPGEWCPDDCQKRGEAILGNDTHPWCFEYGTGITDYNNKSGKYRKCADCLHNTK